MKIVNKYIYKEMSLPVIFGLCLFTFILLIDFLSEMMENIIVKSVPINDVLEILSYYFPPIIQQTIPMGILLGVMIAYGSLSGNSEITAMEASGIGMKQYLIPAFTLGIIITIFMFVLEEKVVPASHDKMVNILKKIAYKKPTIQLESKVFLEIGESSIFLGEIDNKNNIAKNLVVFKKDEQNSMYPQIVLSETAEWKGTSMELQNGSFYNIDRDGKISLQGGFETRKIPVKSFFDFGGDTDSEDISMLSITELNKRIKENKKNKRESTGLEVELQQKLSVPFTCLLLSILGVLLSVKNRRSGKGVSFGVSLIIIFFQYLAVYLGRMVGNSGTVPPVIALWYPNVILLIITSILLVVQMRRR